MYVQHIHRHVCNTFMQSHTIITTMQLQYRKILMAKYVGPFVNILPTGALTIVCLPKLQAFNRN